MGNCSSHGSTAKSSKSILRNSSSTKLAQLDGKEKQQFDQFDAESRQVFPCFVCYFVGSKKIAPIISVDYNANIHNSLAIVDIRQVYENTLDKPSQIEYLFSISTNAVFTKLEVIIGNETMYGVIKEKELAKKEYNQGIKDGKTMVYSEKDDEFPDVMRVKLGNLEPGQKLEVHFQYIQQLEVCVNEFWRLEIDPIISPRYRLAKNDNNFMKKLKSIIDFSTYQPNHQQNIKVQIETISAIKFCKSPTHKIIIDAFVKQNQMNLNLDPNVQDNFRSDKSFVLMFADEDIHKPQLFITHTNNDALQHQKFCATLSLIPKFNPLQLDDAYQAYLYESDIDYNDFAYQQKGEWIHEWQQNKKSKGGFNFIHLIPTRRQLLQCNIFGSDFQLMFDSNEKYSAKIITKAISLIENLEADLGGTEILQPLRKCFQNSKANYPQNIFILTDGEVEPDEVIELVRQNRMASNRVYTLGIGDGCSKYLVEKLAYVGNGTFHFVADDEDLNQKVIDLLQDSITPYLENIQFINSITNFDSITPNPESIICIKKNRPIMIQVLFPTQDKLVSEFTLGFQAFDPQTQQKLEYQNTVKLSDSKEMNYFHKLAAYRQITTIEDEIKYQEPTLQGLIIKKHKIDLKDIIQISLSNQILSKATAFICEVKYMADQFKQQKVIEFYEEPQRQIKADKFQMKMCMPKNNQKSLVSFSGAKSKSVKTRNYQIEEIQHQCLEVNEIVGDQNSQEYISNNEGKRYSQNSQLEDCAISPKITIPSRNKITQVDNQKVIQYRDILKYLDPDGGFQIELQKFTYHCHTYDFESEYMDYYHCLMLS